MNEYYASTPDNPSPSRQGVNLKKLLIPIILILLVAEVVWAVYTLGLPRPATTPSQQISLSPTPTLVPKGELRLLGPTEVKVNNSFKVDVVLSSNKPSTGSDVIIKYDPKLLEVVLSAGKASTVGKTYQEYPTNLTDSRLGEITISGISPSTFVAFSGEGIFATINFKAKAVGSTNLDISFQKGSTTDSNITSKEEDQDILEVTKGLSINITR